MARKRIGELLLERGVITLPQLEEGLALHRSSRQRLGVALVQKGFVSEEQLSKVLAEALGIPELDLRNGQPEWSAIHTLRSRFCESNDLFPFAMETARGRKQLVVAMSDPLNYAAIEEIEFTTGLKVSPRLATLSAIRGAILRYYHKVNPEDAPAGKMTIVHRGGDVHVMDADDTVSAKKPLAPPPPPAEEEIIVGEMLPPAEVTERTALADLIKRREQQHRQRKGLEKGAKKGSPVAAVSQDLDYLFGKSSDEDGVEKLERKFWALMRIMARKGLLTNDEFKKELDEGGE
ncbi:MAG: GspE/PulE/PilB domain-containing protein [Myxococcaceae bacterium]